jgi:hypothetical protein
LNTRSISRTGVSPNPVVCAECGATSDARAEGWRAYLDDCTQAVTFCPECAEREFSDSS